ncbi:MAG TPA: division/cell wall cluster transcriptional repressor MraZ [Kiloniellaceae bacterium]|nr:division/cell wall cluster transcriptional repressor MraZ [Kiloniellaceae bacterium]
MAYFIGTYENKVDRKGRVSVPSLFRQALAPGEFQGIVAFPSSRGKTIEACGMDLMHQVMAQAETVNLLGKKPLRPAADIFYNLKQLAFDGDGRIILPQAFRDFAGIADQAVFVGVGALFQIWSPEALATRPVGEDDDETAVAP